MESKNTDNQEKPDNETMNQWHDDPSNWKLGIFYFNKKDKRIFPPKRISGLDWTVNFANEDRAVEDLLLRYL